MPVVDLAHGDVVVWLRGLQAAFAACGVFVFARMGIRERGTEWARWSWLGAALCAIASVSAALLACGGSAQ